MHNVLRLGANSKMSKERLELYRKISGPSFHNETRENTVKDTTEVLGIDIHK